MADCRASCHGGRNACLPALLDIAVSCVLVVLVVLPALAWHPTKHRVRATWGGRVQGGKKKRRLCPAYSSSC